MSLACEFINMDDLRIFLSDHLGIGEEEIVDDFPVGEYPSVLQKVSGHYGVTLMVYPEMTVGELLTRLKKVNNF